MPKLWISATIFEKNKRFNFGLQNCCLVWIIATHIGAVGSVVPHFAFIISHASSNVSCHSSPFVIPPASIYCPPLRHTGPEARSRVTREVFRDEKHAAQISNDEWHSPSRAFNAVQISRLVNFPTN